MPYFKMESILIYAHKLGYLTYNSKNNQYIPDFNKIAKCKINQNMYFFNIQINYINGK